MAAWPFQAAPRPLEAVSMWIPDWEVGVRTWYLCATVNPATPMRELGVVASYNSSHDGFDQRFGQSGLDLLCRGDPTTRQVYLFEELRVFVPPTGLEGWRDELGTDVPLGKRLFVHSG